MNAPRIYDDRYYSVRIDYDRFFNPIWKNTRPSKCRCGKCSCESCKVAFDAWFTDQVKIVFARELDNLCFVSFKLPVYSLGKGIGGFDAVTVANVAHVVINSTGAFNQRWFGVVDLTIDEIQPKKYQPKDELNWSFHAWLVTTLMTPERIREVEKNMRDAEDIHIKMVIPLQSRMSEESSNKKRHYILPAEYIGWRVNSRGLDYRDPMARTKLREAMFCGSLFEDCVVLINASGNGGNLKSVN